MNTSQIEEILRQAPRPRPPAGLREQLTAQSSLADLRVNSVAPRPSNSAKSWLARWWPVLVPAAASLACAAVMTVQHLEIQALESKLQALPSSAVAVEPAKSSVADAASEGAASAADEAGEVARLRAMVEQLTVEIAQLERMRAENDRLRAQLAAPLVSALSPEETLAMDEARDRALRIQCINNMKQLGLAARVWANDNYETNPPTLLSMTNEMAAPQLLVCPADSGRRPASDWASFTAANCSYEYLAASAPQTEPARVMFRCPIHGNITLCDGSVQSSIAKTHPEMLVQRDGKLYLQSNAEIEIRR
jgi:hypothetical protein